MASWAVIILGILLPAWLLVGLADWNCHRKSKIEQTTGTRESVLHLLMSGQAAVGVMAGLLLEINSLVLLVIILAYAAHEITSTVDLRRAAGKRDFTVTEQRIHEYLTAIPFAALVLVIAAHPQELMDLARLGGGVGNYTIALKDAPLPGWYIAGWISLSVLLNVLPYSEELLRSSINSIKARANNPAANLQP